MSRYSRLAKNPSGSVCGERIESVLASWVNENAEHIIFKHQFILIIVRVVDSFISFGFAHVPSAPGFHSIEISTWKVAANNYFDSLKTRFHTGGLTVSKSDLIYSGVERCDVLN